MAEDQCIEKDAKNAALEVGKSKEDHQVEGKCNCAQGKWLAMEILGRVFAAGQRIFRANGQHFVLCQRRLYDDSVFKWSPANTWPCMRSDLFSTYSEFKSRDSNHVFQRNGGSSIAFDEAKKLLRLVNVEALKRTLESDGHEFITQSELLQVCRSMGVAHSDQEAEDFVKALDEAGVVLIFRNKVYLHPDKESLWHLINGCLSMVVGDTTVDEVAELVMNAVPLVLTEENDPRREELKRLLKEKQEIDNLAHRQVRCVLWLGLVCLSLQTGLFFRLTFWELSWDVMEPIAFFATTGGLLIGYMYFLLTSRDPTYQDLRKRLFLSKQRKLIKKRKFDVNRFLELQKQCKHPFDCKSGLEAVIGD
eukprot:Gb_23230 [translate_table: standard]